MDELDRKIVRLLQEDGRRPYNEIAETLHVPTSMVSGRIENMVKRKWVEIVALADPYDLGFDTPVLIEVSVQPAALKTAINQIAELEEVGYMVMTSGQFDLLLEVLCRDRDHLAEFLNQKLGKIPGLIRTQTHFILRVYRRSHVPRRTEEEGGAG